METFAWSQTPMSNLSLFAPHASTRTVVGASLLPRPPQACHTLTVQQVLSASKELTWTQMATLKPQEILRCKERHN
uniref:Uncharacterized protein n=1 Tax=Oryza rufipogon TaxID=4529 RepID=A0A0E0R456_ORYRU